MGKPELLTLAATTAAIAIGAPPATAAECSPAEQQNYIQRHTNAHTYFPARVMHDVSHPGSSITVSPKGDPGNFMVQPLPIIGKDGEPVAYVGRDPYPKHGTHLERLAADKASVTEYIGHRAIAVRNPAGLIVERMIRASRNSGGLGYLPHFSDRQGHTYGYQP